MTYSRILIEIDDRDVESAFPEDLERPWAARVMQIQTNDAVIEDLDPEEAGLGATIPQALRELADTIELHAEDRRKDRIVEAERQRLL